MIYAFFDTCEDCDAGDDYDEFGESVGFVEFENGPEVDVGFAGSGFHVDGVVSAEEFVVGEEVGVVVLDVLEVFEQTGGAYLEARIPPECPVGGFACCCLLVDGVSGVFLLSFEELYCAVDGIKLVVEVYEPKGDFFFHVRLPQRNSTV